MKAEGKRQKAEGTAQIDSRWLFFCFCLLPSAFCLSSCASLPELPWAPPARDASAGFYDTARLEYRLDAGKLGRPARHRHPEHHLGAAQQPAQQQRKARLQHRVQRHRLAPRQRQQARANGCDHITARRHCSAGW